MEIWKFVLEITSRQWVPMPRGAVVISAANQDGSLCIWAMVNPDHPTVGREFNVIGTGNKVDADVERVFIDTVLIGPFVWHVFELV